MNYYGATDVVEIFHLLQFFRSVMICIGGGDLDISITLDISTFISIPECVQI